MNAYSLTPSRDFLCFLFVWLVVVVVVVCLLFLNKKSPSAQRTLKSIESYAMDGYKLQ